jgi:osmotically-inducible protein OsmY
LAGELPSVRTLVGHTLHGLAGYCVKILGRVNNMSTSLKLAVALALAVTATMDGCAETRTHEATGQYVDDSVITGKVKAAIAGEPSLKVAEINVETFKGVVQLSGFVSQASEISKAVSVARGVGGVQSVKNSLQVKG